MSDVDQTRWHRWHRSLGHVGIHWPENSDEVVSLPCDLLRKHSLKPTAKAPENRCTSQRQTTLVVFQASNFQVLLLFVSGTVEFQYDPGDSSRGGHDSPLISGHVFTIPKWVQRIARMMMMMMMMMMMPCYKSGFDILRPGVTGAFVYYFVCLGRNLLDFPGVDFPSFQR